MEIGFEGPRSGNWSSPEPSKSSGDAIRPSVYGFSHRDTVPVTGRRNSRLLAVLPRDHGYLSRGASKGSRQLEGSENELSEVACVDSCHRVNQVLWNS